MKIVHISPSSPYNDYWGYQENILPKHQKMLGHEVTLIITNKMHENGRVVEVPEADYILKDGVRVIRMKSKSHSSLRPLARRLDSWLDVYSTLESIKPDFIYHHGMVSSTMKQVVKYKKKINPNCVIVQDNHLDYNIGFSKESKKGKLANWFYKRANKKTLPYVSRVYGVTPWRMVYAIKNYGVPIEKADVLIMGADDEKINFANKDQIRKSIRERYNIKDTDLLIVTGGKIDRRKNIHLLINACKTFDNVKLIVFGNIMDDVKEELEKALENNPNTHYIGWIPADGVYDYFLSADLVMFPGQHSVLWEQACACKVPAVFMRWDGMDHVNNGGNSDFVFPITEEDLRDKIEELNYTEKYYKMKNVALSEKTDVYLYSNIAKKSIECAHSINE
ncbi:MAG: glycosyltransferase family 4 protein [Clostridia bacterium]|nr:glycosyltransferase family 4 protein [Clostridia bacterium]